MHRFSCLMLGLCALALVGCDRSPSEAPETAVDDGPAVSAFYSGLAALEMGFFDRAREDLEHSAERFPAEPAIAANLGVLAMRQGDSATAREHLARAQELAPDNADIAMLQGLLESREGRIDEAIERFRRAVELDPEGLQPRFALATELERRGGEVDMGEVRGLIDGLVSDAADNPVLRLEAVRLSARAGDADALAAAIDRLAPLAGQWPQPAQAQYRALRDKAGDPSQAVAEVAFLKNILLREPTYQAALAQVQVPAQAGGEPLTQFIATEVAPATPAAADMALTYTAEELTGDAGGPPTGFALPMVVTDEGPMETLIVAGSILRLPGGDTLTAPPGRLSGANIVTADLGNDGRIDVIVAAEGGLAMHRQGEDGVYRDATLEAGLSDAVRQGAYHGVWAADLELDGDLDLVLGRADGAPLALRNNGDGRFSEQPVLASVEGLQAMVWADLNADGIPDIAALDARGRLHVLRNDLAWTYTPMGAPEGDYLALAIGDAGDDDPRIDLLTLGRDGHILARHGGSGEPPRVLVNWTLPPQSIAGTRLLAADLDNNGVVDLLAAGGGQTGVWLVGEAGFEPLGVVPHGVVSGIADFDGDGLLDFTGVDAQGHAARWQAAGERDYAWQVVRPRALTEAGDNRINTFALGGQVEVRTGQRVQRRAIDSAQVHFGLGAREATDVAWILWPNGTSQAEFDLPAEGTAVALQRLKGSCPWVFTHDGEGLRFVTDFLWRSPLGMRVNAVDTASITQTEDWVRIPGEALAAREGRYEVRITAELWETHFIDAVSLLAVDHPPDTQMVVDERFARAAPELAPIFTGPIMPVATVVDDQGRDWTDVARALDERYIGGFGLGRYQGVTRPHHIEIDLGAAGQGATEGLVLLASGWIYPTDSSINVAVAQGEAVRPQGLRLEVPDGRGGWRVAKPDLGFPAGKNKTVVIDLNDVFVAGTERRVRLHTNLEIYWDRIAIARRQAPVQATSVALATEVADLRYRGFSVTRQPSREMPEIPQYDRLAGATQRWSDLEGYHTRHGDVLELLDQPDDRYVIMNAGDELVLAFDAPPPVEGMVRDFILVGHGWVKDGDYNTAFARTVLPLPSMNEPHYDTPPTTLENDPVYRRHAEDWRRFHTRYVRPARFLSGMSGPAVTTQAAE